MYISTYNGMTLYMYIVGGSESEIYICYLKERKKERKTET